MGPDLIARQLVSSQNRAEPIAWPGPLPADEAAAYAIQDATVRLTGLVGGWKVGAREPQGKVHCAPLPASRLYPSGSTLKGPAWRWRCVELEVALRVGRDLDPQGRLLPPEELAGYFDAVLPTLEVVESRLIDGQHADPLAKLADLQCHGALVVGRPSDMPVATLDLRTLDATLRFDDEVAAQTMGGNPAGDVWHLLAWLAVHAAQRGLPLRQGQIVTTGSCTGLLKAAVGQRVEGNISGAGTLSFNFEN